ncbi:NADH-quinone oxidoreductase subunit A [Pyrobaculum sp. 3827-6]|jgi:NADH-quinone oxidoreductase subunit A|uniref:NADH-quinone oxidoreductase subunit A n=1 Tax=Pyrobaculum sp. 3827-6 TaxID=2983604 RepID=UPI0021D8B6EC|nr:NADH-quinone oxidoreductase subunit A [Pyrobaculum sp. 3827-6]MCU7786683.1 NADH-quinone oxidoreductase subunit A [Pyrobaculum sp. 3827-6]
MSDAVAVALAFTILFLLMIGTVYLVMLIAPRRPTPGKLMRYEAGNPETGPAKAPLAMQYLGYILMLVALEPAVAIPLAVQMAFKDLALTATTALIGGVVAVAASLYGYHYAKKIELWRASA